jgi:hypothetical protein
LLALIFKGKKRIHKKCAATGKSRPTCQPAILGGAAMTLTQAATVFDRLVGSWKLITFHYVAEDTNERGDVYESPCGVLTFTATGRMMTIITAGDRGPNADPRDLFCAMMAYSGQYRIQGDDTFIVKVDAAWHPSWIGTEQVRFFKLEGETLSVTSPAQYHPMFPGRLVRGMVTFKKE